MAYNIGNLKLVESPNRTNASGRYIRLVVIHDMEFPERDDAAESVANFFHNSSVQASAHLCVDDNSAVRCVKDEDVAWAAPGANSDGLQMELAGYSSQKTSDWEDSYSKDELKLAAHLTAQWCRKYNIPVKKLTHSELAAGKKGIIGHRDATAVYHLSTHTDPGTNFPWGYFIKLVKAAYADLTDKPAPTPKPASKVSVKELEIAVHLRKPNEEWTKRTDYALKVVRQGPSGHFPVKDLQKFVGTTVDGDWGGVSQGAYIKTVRAIQKALGVTADGVWGPGTNTAYHKARAKYFLDK